MAGAGDGNLALTEHELLFAQDPIALWVKDLDGWLEALGAGPRPDHG